MAVASLADAFAYEPNADAVGAPAEALSPYCVGVAWSAACDEEITKLFAIKIAKIVLVAFIYIPVD